MQQTYSLFKSRTFWTLVAMSLLPILNAIAPTLPLFWQNLAEVLLSILAAYFHNSTAQNSGAIN